MTSTQVETGGEVNLDLYVMRNQNAKTPLLEYQFRNIIVVHSPCVLAPVL
jgi:hypothetical protein